MHVHVSVCVTLSPQERSSYLEYQKVTRELEFNTRLLVAYQFVQAEVSG